MKENVKMAIRIGIYGYGNIARSVEKAIAKADDMTLEAIFTRRDPSDVITSSGIKAVSADRVLEYKEKIDVMLLCGGSATDLPKQGPEMAKHFNVVDTFDTHAKIPEYLKEVNASASANKKTAVISAGWDPGLFSMMKSVFDSAMPDGATNVFWGPGVSQGHSDAVRRVPGVTGAVQYTVPAENILNAAKDGFGTEYTTKQRHRRICFVTVKKSADKKTIERAIREMPDYFADYDTEVNFISEDELKREHSRMPHGGYVIRNGRKEAEGHQMEFSIRFGSNPDFTASIMAAYARAAFRLYGEKDYGAKTVLDIPPSYLSPKDREQQVSEML
jgi:diaminopimelate dehydrogenase